MVKKMWISIMFPLIFLMGCKPVQDTPVMPADVSPAPTANIAVEKYTNEDMLTKSYPWRCAYAEFLWDYNVVKENFKNLFIQLGGNELYYDNYSAQIGFLFIDDDNIPEMLVFFRSNYPPDGEYFAIYHYANTKETSGSIELYFESMCYRTPFFSYLPHGNAFYCGYSEVMHGFHDYDLFYLENGQWKCWDDMPVIVSRSIAEQYGVFDKELISIHDDKPELRNVK